MRLAEHVEHTVDYDGMLDRMSPEQFDMWVAKDIVEPIGGFRWIVDQLALIAASFASTKGNEVKPKMFKPRYRIAPKDEKRTHASTAAIKCFIGSFGASNSYVIQSKETNG